MSTCILYVDESGDVRKHDVPLKNSQTPIFTLTGLALPLEEWRNIDRDYLNLKCQYFQTEINKSKRRREQYEVKGGYLSAPRNKNSRRNLFYTKKLFELINRYSGTLFGITVIKDAENPTSAKSIYTSSLQYMTERFNCYIAENNMLDKGLIIADSTRRFDNDIASSHMSFIFGSETGKSLTCICEAPLFADSKLTAGLQLVDNLSSVLYANHYHYYCRSVPGAVSYEHMKQHWDSLKSIQFHSRKKYDGYQIHGFRTIDFNKTID